MMILFIDEWDYFELFLVMTFQEQPHTFLHRRSGFFSIVDGTSTVRKWHTYQSLFHISSLLT